MVMCMSQSICTCMSCLQTVPTERITIDALMNNSWVLKGYGKPVDWKSRANVSS